MNRRAKLDLSGQPSGRGKEVPDLDDAGGVDADFEFDPAQPVPALHGRRLVRVLAVVAVGALCLYLLTRRR